MNASPEIECEVRPHPDGEAALESLLELLVETITEQAISGVIDAPKSSPQTAIGDEYAACRPATNLR